MVIDVQRLRVENELFVLTCDLKNFFHSIDWFRCRRILRGAGVGNKYRADSLAWAPFKPIGEFVIAECHKGSPVLRGLRGFT